MDRKVEDVEYIKYSLSMFEVNQAVKSYVDNHKSQDGIDGIVTEDATVEWKSETGPCTIIQCVVVNKYVKDIASDEQN